ncbi:MAG: hypothetical protein OXC81_04835 [Betaproteobacteria bacterium]|nr:hypothetical protein [Betaproteobacteria bacterium]
MAEIVPKDVQKDIGLKEAREEVKFLEEKHVSAINIKWENAVYKAKVGLLFTVAGAGGVTIVAFFAHLLLPAEYQFMSQENFNFVRDMLISLAKMVMGGIIGLFFFRNR